MQNTTPPLKAQTHLHSSDRSSNPSATEGADTWYNPHNGTSLKLIIYEQELLLKQPTTQGSSKPPPKRKPDDIQRFSRKSRLRVIRRFNRLQKARLTSPLFITLTARNQNYTAKEFRYLFRKVFLPKLKSIIPDLVYSWRIEPHESGFPHVHMFAWSYRQDITIHSQYYKRPIRRIWRNAIDDHSRAAELYSCKIKEITHFKRAMHYVCKYMAKEDQYLDTELTGRRWGFSSNFPDDPISEIAITRDQAKVIISIAQAIQRKRNERTGNDFQLTGEEAEIFILADKQQIFDWLLLLNRSAEAGIYARVVNRGSPLPDSQEIEQLAQDFGFDY